MWGTFVFLKRAYWKKNGGENCDWHPPPSMAQEFLRSFFFVFCYHQKRRGVPIPLQNQASGTLETIDEHTASVFVYMQFIVKSISIDLFIVYIYIY